jgi:hypothetical protein
MGLINPRSYSPMPGLAGATAGDVNDQCKDDRGDTKDKVVAIRETGGVCCTIGRIRH